MAEIGSEFCDYIPHTAALNEANRIYVASGRTALDYIIRDILAEHSRCGAAYLPGYCCDSMIQPFFENHIPVQFYSVSVGRNGFEIDYDPTNTCRIVYLTDYFGYRNSQLPEIAKEARKAGMIVIYDATHMLNSKQYIEYDYMFCSYRKWFCTNTAVVEKNGVFLIAPPVKTFDAYLTLRRCAVRNKRRYFSGLISDKQGYLDDFRRAEELLDREYTEYGSDSMPMIDADDMLAKRRENAHTIMNELLDAVGIDLIVKTVKNEDCPLFVPILIPSEIRTKVRKQLIEQEIYCPIHWPLSEYHGDVCEQLYQQELSLVCDQRYDSKDMLREANAIKMAVKKCMEGV